MGTIIKKMSKQGKAYFSYFESMRVNGEVKVKKQIYLGSAERILEMIQKQQLPESMKNFSFGLEMALYECARELNLEKILERHSNGKNKGVQTGKVLLAAIITRCMGVRSKNRIKDIWEKTILKDVLSLEKKDVRSQRVWEGMENIDEESIGEIEKEVWEELLKVKVRVKGEKGEEKEIRVVEIMDEYLYDTTNFYGFLSDFTPSELYKRGRNKAGRHNKRQVGMAVVLEKGSGIPIFHELFGGNLNDASLFPGNMKKLIDRMSFLHQNTEGAIIVMDRSNNNKNVFKELIGHGMHIVGSLKSNTKTELWDEEPRSRVELSNGKVVYCKTGELKMGELELKCVVCVNKDKRKREEKKLNEQLRRVITSIRSIGTRRKGGVRKKRDEVAVLLKRYKLSNLIDVEWEGDNIKSLKVNKEEYERRMKRAGKTILFTDNKKLKMKEVVEIYRSQYEVEHFFRDIKNPLYISIRPIYHRIDHFIKIHALICILAYILMKLLQRKLELNGIKMSLNVIQEELQDIMYSILIYSKDAVFKTLKKLSDRSTVQDKICEIAGIYTWAKKLDISP